MASQVEYLVETIKDKQLEEAKDLYHGYISCLFDYSMAKLLSSPGSNVNGVLSANNPTAPEFVKDLLDPKTACLSGEKLNELLQSTGPSNILQKTLESNKKYKVFLNALYMKYISLPIKNNNNKIDDILYAQGIFKKLINNEINNSVVAIGTAFQSLKDFRKYFLMHVQFQCMIKNLEEYRRKLENLRSVIYIIPDLLRNASKH